MKSLIFLLLALTSQIASSQTKPENNMIAETKSLTCKLTTRELQERKRTVIADLKAALLERVEIANGMRYKFPGADRDIEKLVSFIKTERMCCGFFHFHAHCF